MKWNTQFNTLSMSHHHRVTIKHNIQITELQIYQKLLPAHRHMLSVRSQTGNDDHDQLQALGAVVCPPYPHHPEPCTLESWTSHRQELSHLPAALAGTGVSGNPTAEIHNLKYMQCGIISHKLAAIHPANRQPFREYEAAFI